MPLKKLKYICILAFIFSLNSRTIVFDSEAVRNIAARDLYDLLTKISSVHGLSYGIIGQPVMLQRIGKSSAEISLYIDDIYYGKRIAELTFFSVDQIESIILDDRSVENSGVTVNIHTKSYNSVIPVSEVKYRDAFFNYRDLTANIFQHATDNFSFLISGEVFDWKDNRDRYDDFKFPYEKQNYRVKLIMPQMRFIKPVLDISYMKEDKFTIAADSSHIKPENIRSVLYFDSRLDSTKSNRFSAVHIHEINENSSNYFSFYDTFTFSDTLGRFESKAGFDTQISKNYLTYLKADYKKKSFIDYGLTGYFALNDRSEQTRSLHLDFSKDLSSIISFETTHGYFSQDANDQNIDLLENFFSLKKSIKSGNYSFDFVAAYDMFNYDRSSDRNFYRLEFGTDYKNKFKFRNEYLRSASGKIYDTVFMNNLSEISFSDKYFNDKLTVNLALYHNYSEYLIGSSMEYMNNLSLNFIARIVNFEFFFGSDNFLKDKYEFGDNTYEVNEHYRYQTVDGFDMRTMDEIWGVRWIFYR